MRKNVICVLLLCSASVIFGAEQKPWYAKKLMPRDNYVTDFTLNPGEARDVQIKTDKTLRVSFVTDITWEQSEKYKGTANENPIVMKRVRSESFVSSLLGAGATYKPVDGAITLTITNTAKADTFKVVIVSKDDK